MKLPDTPSSGSKIDAAWAKQVVDYLRSITPRGVGVSRTSNGATVIGSGAQERIKRAIGVRAPFKISDASTDDAAKITVGKGWCNGAEVKLGGVVLSADPAPTLTLATSAMIFIKVVGVEATTLFGARTRTATIYKKDYDPDTDFFDQVPAEEVSETGWTAYVLVGLVIVDEDAGKITDLQQELFYNIGVDNYGAGNAVWIR